MAAWYIASLLFYLVGFAAYIWIVVEAFQDDAAGDHVNSDHFKKAMADMPQALVETPKIISRQLDGEGWDLMGELTIG